MAKNNLYTLVIDDNLDGKFRELKRRFKKGEKILTSVIHGDKMIVTTEIVNESNSKLLLENQGR